MKFSNLFHFPFLSHSDRQPTAEQPAVQPTSQPKPIHRYGDMTINPHEVDIANGGGVRVFSDSLPRFHNPHSDYHQILAEEIQKLSKESQPKPTRVEQTVSFVKAALTPTLEWFAQYPALIIFLQVMLAGIIFASQMTDMIGQYNTQRSHQAQVLSAKSTQVTEVSSKVAQTQTLSDIVQTRLETKLTHLSAVSEENRQLIAQATQLQERITALQLKASRAKGQSS